jgi:xanthine dehydrogenase small subunit
MRPAMMLDLSAVTALQTIADAPSQITIGAGVSLTRVMALFEKLHPALYQLMSRFGGKQVRNSGTIGGNIGNGSPIGDLAPLLLVLNASLTLTSLHSSRQIKLEQFFLDYKMQDILPNELIEAIHIPKPLPDHIHIHKLSKRHDEDISTLLFALSHDQQKRHIRLAFGGMAAIPKRAIYTEKLIEKGASFEEIAEGLAVDYAPITDVRASREYRIKAAQNLLIRALS